MKREVESVVPDFALASPAPAFVTLPSDAVDHLLRAANGDAALLYLYLSRRAGPASDEETLSALHWAPQRLSAAADALAAAGLLQPPQTRNIAAPAVFPAPPEAPPERELPEYTANDIVRAMEKDERFRLLVDEAQRRLGKILSSSDLTILFGLYDYLGLPLEVLYLLINYCVEESHRRYGPGRRPTLRQIEKEGYLWARKEIDTEERAAEYLRRLSQRRSQTGWVMEILQIRGRALTRTEEKYIESWLDMGFGMDALELAYEKTVFKCKEFAWNYMNSILKNWHQKGLHTLPEIEKGDRGRRSPSDCSPSPSKSRRRDIDQMKDYLKKLKEQGD